MIAKDKKLAYDKLSKAEKIVKIKSALVNENGILKADFSNVVFEDGKTIERYTNQR